MKESYHLRFQSKVPGLLGLFLSNLLISGFFWISVCLLWLIWTTLVSIRHFFPVPTGFITSSVLSQKKEWKRFFTSVACPISTHLGHGRCWFLSSGVEANSQPLHFLSKSHNQIVVENVIASLLCDRVACDREVTFHLLWISWDMLCECSYLWCYMQRLLCVG